MRAIGFVFILLLCSGVLNNCILILYYILEEKYSYTT